MTRKDYVVIAKALAASKPGNEDQRLTQWKYDVSTLSYHLFLNNPRFDAGKFTKACGLEA